MTTKQAAEILKAFNGWRNGNGPCDPPYTGKKISEAIYIAVQTLENSVVKADIESIIKAVTRETGVTEAEMCQRGRDRENSEARAIVSFLAYRFTSMTLTAIGKRLGRNHAVAIYYNKVVNSWLRDRRLNPRGYNITKSLILELENEHQS